ncbi:MAG: hypothetical protein IT437_03735, partial [Phycisphaerales bacterium]|nr:hypothetical protein [Phycisphaerales bacterium]
ARYPGDNSAMFDQGIGAVLGGPNGDEVFVVGQFTYSVTNGSDAVTLRIFEQ